MSADVGIEGTAGNVDFGCGVGDLTTASSLAAGNEPIGSAAGNAMEPCMASGRLAPGAIRRPAIARMAGRADEAPGFRKSAVPVDALNGKFAE